MANGPRASRSRPGRVGSQISILYSTICWSLRTRTFDTTCNYAEQPRIPRSSSTLREKLRLHQPDWPGQVSRTTRWARYGHVCPDLPGYYCSSRPPSPSLSVNEPNPEANFARRNRMKHCLEKVLLSITCELTHWALCHFGSYRRHHYASCARHEKRSLPVVSRPVYLMCPALNRVFRAARVQTPPDPAESYAPACLGIACSAQGPSGLRR